MAELYLAVDAQLAGDVMDFEFDLLLPDDGKPVSEEAFAEGWLKADGARKVTLVGHTDASGGLEANVRLSKARAESVRRWLIDRLGVGADQVAAEGVGYLAPRATNQTEEGRQKNRRVEVISTSTQLLAP